MHTPTKSQWQTVIDNLKKVLPMATMEGHLNMLQSEVNYEHRCGTIHCVGGWYAISTCDLSNTVDYEDGAHNMATHLGFKRKEDMKRYYDDRLDLWGNGHAINMFLTPCAYYHHTKRPEGAQTLQHVIDHFEEVRDRSPE